MTTAIPIDPGAPANDAPADSGPWTFGSGPGERRPSTRPFSRGDETELGKRLVEVLSTTADAPAVADRDALYTYSAKTGAWSKVPEHTLAQIVMSFTACVVKGDKKDKAVSVSAKNVKGAIQSALWTAAKPGFFDAAAPGFAFSNGFVRCSAAGVEVVPHDPKHAALFSYPFAYDPAAKCDRWKAVLAGAFKGDEDAADKIACLQEHAGASLFGQGAKFHRALMMWGTGSMDGRNGKSTIADVLKSAFPKEAVSAIPPQDLSREYQRAQLAGKLFNVVGETPEADILDGGHFKSAVAGDAMNARNPMGRPFDHEPKAGWLMMCNTLFGTNDHSSGFWERWIVITFNRTIPEAERIAGLHELIIAEERAGIVSWIIDGAVRIMQRGKYTIPASSRAAVEQWRRRTNSVALFLEERCVPTKTLPERSRSSDLFDTFKEWAERNRLGVMSIVKFAMRMTALGFPAEQSAAGSFYPWRPRRPEDPAPGATAPPSGICSVCDKVFGNRDDGACEPCPRCARCTSVKVGTPGSCECP